MSEPPPSREIEVPTGAVTLPGDLTVPAEGSSGRLPPLVIFAHGSGSSRHSPRNRQVARALAEAGCATLLFDLLTAEEGKLDERTAQLRFDIALLAGRLAEVVDWMRAGHELGTQPVGLFGASTGAAAALVAAGKRPHDVGAVVSRGGRPDLAGDTLSAVRAPTLLVVGGRDVEVLSLNERAAARLTAEHRVAVVPGAGHLFAEPGALEQVADLAVEWFRNHLHGAVAGREAPDRGSNS